MTSRLTMLLALAMSIAVAAVGCGSDGGDEASAIGADGTTGTAATALSKADYLKQANAGCRRERASLEKDVSKFARALRGREKAAPVYYAELAHFVLLPDIEAEMEAVRALGAPPGPPSEEQKIDRLLYLEELPLIEIADSKTVASLAAIDQKFVKSGRLLREYGLPSCARGPEATRLGDGLLEG